MRRRRKRIRLVLAVAILLGVWQLGPRPPLPASRYLNDSNVAGALLNLDPGHVNILADLLIQASPTDQKGRVRNGVWIRLLFPLLAPVQIGALLEKRPASDQDPAWVLVARPRRLPFVLRAFLKSAAKEHHLVFRERNGFFLLSREEPLGPSASCWTRQSSKAKPSPGLTLWLEDGEALGRFLSGLLASKNPDLDPQLGPHLFGKIQKIEASFRMKSPGELDGTLILSSSDPLGLGVYRFFLLACRDLLEERLKPKGATVTMDLLDAPGRVMIMLNLKGNLTLLQKGEGS